MENLVAWIQENQTWLALAALLAVTWGLYKKLRALIEEAETNLKEASDVMKKYLRDYNEEANNGRDG